MKHKHNTSPEAFATLTNALINKKQRHRNVYVCRGSIIGKYQVVNVDLRDQHKNV